MAQAKFRVLEQSWIGDRMCEPGSIVTIETDHTKGGMVPGPNLAPVVDAPAPTAEHKDEDLV